MFGLSQRPSKLVIVGGERPVEEQRMTKSEDKPPPVCPQAPTLQSADFPLKFDDAPSEDHNFFFQQRCGWLKLFLGGFALLTHRLLQYLPRACPIAFQRFSPL